MTQTLEAQIEKIVSLKPGDNEGEINCRYRRETVESGIKLIPQLKELMLKEIGYQIGEPHLSPGVEGSIDFYWLEEKKYELLMNIRNDGSARYYGDNFSDKNIKGELR